MNPQEARRRSFSIGLRTLLTSGTLLTVLLTATLVYVPWYLTATRNVDDAVRAIDRQISERVTAEIERLLMTARSSVQALRTVLFQRVVSSTDEARREFLFLAHLQSDPSLSWVSVGFPNGDFFGAHKTLDGSIQMVATSWNAERGEASLRIDHYEPAGGDIWFLRREQGVSSINATRLPWYQLGSARSGEARAAWTAIHELPLHDDAGISAAVELQVFDEAVGVLSVSIALSRISRFLDTLSVGASGSVYVVDESGALVAAKTNTTAGTDAGIIRLQLALSAMERDAIELTGLRDLRQLEVVDAAGASFYVGVSPVLNDELSATSWTVITVIPATDFVSGIDRNNERLALALAAFVGFIALAAVLVSGYAIDRPLARIVSQLRHIENFQLDKVMAQPSRIREVALLSRALLQMTRGLAGFVRYLPTELVQALVARGQEDRPQIREATILYLDLQGFTRIGEQLTPALLVELLNEFFSLVYERIQAHHGAVLQFQGDAILASFNVPADCEDHRRQAVRCALAIDAALADREFVDGIRLRARIGINSGEVIAGTVGSAARANYTIHGDPVNLAARLEALNKQHGSRILASARTMEGLSEEFECERIGEVEVRGKQRGVTVYRLA